MAGAVLWALAGCGEPTTAMETGDDEGSTAASGSSGAVESSGGEPGPPMPLVRADGWELADAEGDPFAADRPALVQCELGYGVETGVFEVSTDLCAHGAFVQHTLAPIHAGDTIELVLLHDALYAEEPATAHLGVGFGTEIAWETEVPIPSEPGQLRPTWTAPTDVAAASPVHFHVHNHGTNNYRFVALTVSRP